MFMLSYYLIDYEKVRGDGLSGCQDLGKTDHIVIFFTQNAKNIDMSDISNSEDCNKITREPLSKRNLGKVALFL